MIPKDIIAFQIEIWLHDCICRAHAGQLLGNLVLASGYGCPD